MKHHVGRLALGGIVLTLTFVIYWAMQTFPYTKEGFVLIFFFGAAYVIGVVIEAMWSL